MKNEETLHSKLYLIFVGVNRLAGSQQRWPFVLEEVKKGDQRKQFQLIGIFEKTLSLAEEDGSRLYLCNAY